MTLNYLQPPWVLISHPAHGPAQHLAGRGAGGGLRTPFFGAATVPGLSETGGIDAVTHETQGLAAPGSWQVGDLAAQSQLANHRAVAIDVLADEVRQKAPALTDELQQTATGVVVVLVGAQMLRQ